jgi:DNA invertase Pin-like site-specific DNA recombinase
MGHVGLVLGLDMSRLARAGQDWHQLIELCSLAGALLADADGVYDPNEYNDRLLLGLSAPSGRPSSTSSTGRPGARTSRR